MTYPNGDTIMALTKRYFREGMNIPLLRRHQAINHFPCDLSYMSMRLIYVLSVLPGWISDMS